MKARTIVALFITSSLATLPMVGGCQSEQKHDETIDSLEGGEEGGGEAKKGDAKKGKKGKKGKKAKKK